MPRPKELVILESPYAGDVERNRKYLNAAIRDSLRRNEAPIASHKLYTDSLDDNIERERTCGIEAGFAWWAAAARIVFYIDHGMSKGMQAALERAGVAGKPVVTRMVDGWDPVAQRVKP